MVCQDTTLHATKCNENDCCGRCCQGHIILTGMVPVNNKSYQYHATLSNGNLKKRRQKTKQPPPPPPPTKKHTPECHCTNLRNFATLLNNSILNSLTNPRYQPCFCILRSSAQCSQVSHPAFCSTWTTRRLPEGRTQLAYTQRKTVTGCCEKEQVENNRKPRVFNKRRQTSGEQQKTQCIQQKKTDKWRTTENPEYSTKEDRQVENNRKPNVFNKRRQTSGEQQKTQCIQQKKTDKWRTTENPMYSTKEDRQVENNRKPNVFNKRRQTSGEQRKPNVFTKRRQSMDTKTKQKPHWYFKQPNIFTKWRQNMNTTKKQQQQKKTLYFKQKKPQLLVVLCLLHFLLTCVLLFYEPAMTTTKLPLVGWFKFF